MRGIEPGNERESLIVADATHGILLATWWDPVLRWPRARAEAPVIHRHELPAILREGCALPECVLRIPPRADKAREGVVCHLEHRYTVPTRQIQHVFGTCPDEVTMALAGWVAEADSPRRRDDQPGVDRRRLGSRTRRAFVAAGGTDRRDELT